MFKNVANLIASRGGNDLPAVQVEHLRNQRQFESESALAIRAVNLLRSICADVSALRVDGGDTFAGTGSCEFGHESVEVTLEWPNLAILNDEAQALLAEVEAAAVEHVWYVFHGDCETPYHCIATDREEAMEFCALALPGVKVVVAVPADSHGNLVLEAYGEDFVRCPICGARTDFGELPREGWQVHECLKCSHSFIAVPDDDDDDDESEGDVQEVCHE